MGITFLTSDAAAPYDEILRAGASLEGAIARPETLHHYAGSDDLVALAAALLEAVNRAHALVDGNKRASIRLTDLFLAKNHLHIEGSDDDIVDLVVGVAAGEVPLEAATQRLRQLVVAGFPHEQFEARYPAVIHRLSL